ncbi:MAG: hypothetical protein LBS21_15035 [Clostridiales bacterium]|jgi:hypothetical protein|nr:hypothetical protein [Clostridiales bacterium]
MKFKSSPLILAASFIPVLLAVCAISLALLLAQDAQKFYAAVMGGAFAVIAAGIYVCFVRSNITVHVDTDAVRFYRAGKEYLNFPYSGFEFTSYVLKHTYNGIPTYTSRYLKVTSKESGKSKNHRCSGFNKSSFEMLMAYIRLAVSEKNNVDITYTPDGNAHFRINKHAIARKYAKVLALLTIAVGVILLFLVYIVASANSPVYTYTFSGCAAVIIISIILKYAPPIFSVKKNTPEVITLYRDSLALGEKILQFANIKLIKLTPPSYRPDGTDFLLARKLTVIYGEKTYVYILDVKERYEKSVSAFKGYEEFFAVVENIFSGHPEKFMRELG